MRGMGNIQGMMQKMQKMQKQMEKEQKAIEETVYTAKDPSGMVAVEMNGKRELIDLAIQPEAVDPEDVDMLQDLIITAVNDALRQVDTDTQERLGSFTQGLNLPF
ncbi:YbaB/EbfC family nucleoid-associated protein [Dolosicoccus paucivorans]|uniref:Nucleoid-associated protein CJ205_05220 n=1 Tax=Dolosicoccus paucivorans TaxID=84521 RepID=A0A2N6SMG1_9LACT|nr:YbaB/EbfC family nucleoid-associated protein [Dolosicoccus paucivorans]PMB83975.1 YbaB/EbfC family nucleoid-associated protein [Dolosicoccus paucivorans]PMC58255.1 YbaB/EbfC family nucleoid-associated protein [Dolosicoccus paucivorans]